MKPSKIKTTLQTLIKTRWPAFLWGPPGVGKSSVVRETANAAGLELLDVRASLLDPTDLRGIPAIENGRAVWCPPSFLPSDPKSSGVLFFDELNAAPPLVQASLYQLTLDRRVGEYILPEGWRIVAAGNRAEDNSITFRMPAALANRFIHLDFEIDFEDWRNWAVNRGIAPLVIAFLSTRPELLHQMDNPERGFPTPRSWEMVSDVIIAHGDDSLVDDLVAGIIGEAAAIEFLAYCSDSIREEDILKIINNPATAELPEKLSDLYALVSYLAVHGSKEKERNAAAVILGRLSPEFGVLLLRNILTVYPQFATAQGVRKFMSEHSSLIAA